jgi:hypothetical protein
MTLKPDSEKIEAEKMRRMIAILFLSISIPLLVAACGGGDETEPPATEQPPATERPTDVASETDEPGGVFVVDQPAPGPACALVPLEGSVLEVRQDASSDSELLGQVEVGHYILATRRNQDFWYQVSLADTPVDGGWVAPDNVFVVQDCACDELCAAFDIPDAAPTITDCNVSFEADQTITIYFLPDENSEIFSVSTAGDGAAGLAQARTADGWIGFDPGIAQAGREGVSRLRWIQETDAVSLSGTQCNDLPTYGYTPVNP